MENIQNFMNFQQDILHLVAIVLEFGMENVFLMVEQLKHWI